MFGFWFPGSLHLIVNYPFWQVNYDGELHKHPQLEADLSAVREIYGPHAVSLRYTASVYYNMS